MTIDWLVDANDDTAVTGDRGFSEFHLFARNPSTMLFESIYSFSKPFDEEACEDKAQLKYDKAQAKRIGCPPCLDAAALAATMRTHLDDQNGNLYCGF